MTDDGSLTATAWSVLFLASHKWRTMAVPMKSFTVYSCLRSLAPFWGNQIWGGILVSNSVWKLRNSGAYHKISVMLICFKSCCASGFPPGLPMIPSTRAHSGYMPQYTYEQSTTWNVHNTVRLPATFNDVTVLKSFRPHLHSNIHIEIQLWQAFFLSFSLTNDWLVINVLKLKL